AAALAKAVSSAWVEFARAGKPAAEGLPEWPAFSKDGRESMHINNTSEVGPYMGTGPRKFGAGLAFLCPSVQPDKFSWQDFRHHSAKARIADILVMK
ncbi:MAG: carboxylesterase family protein, partial [Phaeodactylibacter sp.]|nr:carboxylesterase family protein [Phaeodactylibacter sp.]